MHLKVLGLSLERADPLLHPAISKEAFYLGWYSLLLLFLTGLSRFLSPASPLHALQAISENCAGCAVHRSGQHQYF